MNRQLEPCVRRGVTYARSAAAEGPARAADRQLAARYSSPRVRTLARLLLAAVRTPERPR